MQQVLNEVGRLAQQLFAAVWQVLQFVWNWSFGQIVKMFQMPFANLPIWKQVLSTVKVISWQLVQHEFQPDADFAFVRPTGISPAESPQKVTK